MEETNKKSVEKIDGKKGKKSNKNNNKMKFFVLLFLNIIIISSLPIYSKIMLKTLPPFTILFFVFLLVYIILSPTVAKRGEISWKNFKNNFFPSFLLVMSFIILLLILPIVKVYNVILIYTAVSLLSIFYLYLSKKAKFDSEQKTALLVGFIGLFLVIFESLIRTSTTKIVNNFWTIAGGNVLIFISSVFFVLYLFYYKQKETKKLVSTFSLIYYTSILAILISFFPMVFIDFQNITFIYKITLFKVVLGVILVIANVLVFNLSQKHIFKNFENLNLSKIYFQPIIGIILTCLVLDEKITFIALLGMFLIILGKKSTIKILKEPKKIIRKSKNNNLTINTTKENSVPKKEPVLNIGNVQNGDILKVQVISNNKQ